MKMILEIDTLENLDTFRPLLEFLANFGKKSTPNSSNSISSSNKPTTDPTEIITIPSIGPLHQSLLKKKGLLGGKRSNAGRKPTIRIADPASPVPIMCDQCKERIVGEYIIKKHKILCKTCQNENLPYPDPYLYSHPVPQTT